MIDRHRTPHGKHKLGGVPRSPYKGFLSSRPTRSIGSRSYSFPTRGCSASWICSLVTFYPTAAGDKPDNGLRNSTDV